jgi:hypothetical protein
VPPFTRLHKILKGNRRNNQQQKAIDRQHRSSVAPANATGGSAAVKLVLAPVLLSGITTPLNGHTLPGPPFAAGPIYSAAVSPATTGTNVSVTCRPHWVVECLTDRSNFLAPIPFTANGTQQRTGASEMVPFYFAVAIWGEERR